MKKITSVCVGLLCQNKLLRLSSSNLGKSLFYQGPLRCLSNSTIKYSDDGVQNFEGMLSRRRCEAQRSIVVQVANANNAEALWKQCSAVGSVSAIMHYSTLNRNNNKLKEMMLVEFASAESVTEMLLHGGQVLPDTIPVRSLFFNYQPKEKKKQRGSKAHQLSVEEAERCRQIEMPKVFRDEELDYDSLQERLSQCESVSQQMQAYYDCNKSSDIQNRLRFLTCRQIEVAVSGVFPHACNTPFGSSVNGFGHRGSDLDMVLALAPQNALAKCPELVCCGPDDINGSIEKRSVVVRSLDTVANLLSMLPGCQHMIRILRARVPIVKFNHKLTNIECDLSMNNWSGVYMSEMLYNYCQLDSRVAPLVASLRLWAKESALTSIYPGRWITNFSISMLALHYLIIMKLLPPLQLLKKYARTEDKRTAEDEVDCTFLRDIALARSLLEDSPHQDMSLEDLLVGFFEYYSQFDFKNRAVSILVSSAITKPSPGAFYIENPLSPELNVSRNVTMEEVERFRGAVNKALKSLHTAQENHQQWSLSQLWGEKRRASTVYRRGNLNWQNLFSGEDSNAPNTKKSSMLSAPSSLEGRKDSIPTDGSVPVEEFVTSVIPSKPSPVMITKPKSSGKQKGVRNGKHSKPFVKTFRY